MAMIPLSDLLQCLAGCSRKAARIAQIFRGEHDLFGLLVEDKPQIEKQRQVVRDFKTLADVLVQETIKRDVAERFPALLSNIQGEEQNSFQNSLGESICVELTSSADATAALLRRVLAGRDHVATALARAVHDAPPSPDRPTLHASPATVPADAVAIWIDPIDSTAEYIQGKNEEDDCYGIQHNGLKCVCVLIGAYDLRSGDPILGVVNQPFYSQDPVTMEWNSNLYWAIHTDSESTVSSTLVTNKKPASSPKKIVVLSCFEDQRLQDILRTKYHIVYASGAGHKSLLVACGTAHLYVLSMGTTYFWDTCGPHTLLAAQGGGIVAFSKMVGASPVDLKGSQIRYVGGEGGSGLETFRNSDGFIAYRDPKDVAELVDLLKENGYCAASQK